MFNLKISLDRTNSKLEFAVQGYGLQLLPYFGRRLKSKAGHQTETRRVSSRALLFEAHVFPAENSAGPAPSQTERPPAVAAENAKFDKFLSVAGATVGSTAGTKDSTRVDANQTRQLHDTLSQ